MNKKVITFGEVMLRLSPPGFTRFLQAERFNATVGGAEANVAVALAIYGLNSYFVSKLPRHEIGQSVINQLRRYGVGTDYIIREGERVGLYFLENGASQRASKVIYDRAYSSITTLKTGELDWDNIFSGADWFHWSGITPALGENPRNSLVVACKVAKSKGVTVSCDLNFRKKLWSEAEAQKNMIPLMQFVDVCFANEEDAQKSLGLRMEESDVEQASLDESSYVRMARQLKSKFNFKAVAITLRESFSASRNGWSALLLDDRDCSTGYRSKKYDIQIVDRVGGGDSFASGLIYALLTKNNTRQALEFAVAASCLNQTIPGDFNLVSLEEIEKLAAGSGAGRVER